MSDEPKYPDMSTYVSPKVFEGKRVLSPEEAERHRERFNRALARRKDEDNV